MKSVRATLAVFAAVVLFAGCSKLIGNLRHDLDDSQAYDPPVSGGSFPEGGFLDDESSGSDSRLGHYDRRIASAIDDPQMTGAEALEDGAVGYMGGSRAMANLQGAEGRVRGAGATANRFLKKFKTGSRATKADFVDESTTEGSLWASDGQTNYYFTKNKIRGVGDLVTITVEDMLLKDVHREVMRTLSPKEKELEMASAKERVRSKHMGGEGDASKDSVTGSQAAPARAPALVKPAANSAYGDPENPKVTAADIDLSKSLELKAGDTIMAEIVERYPNGNYKLRANKRVPYRNTVRNLSMVAVAKGTEISEDDKIGSGKLFEYRLEVMQ